MTIRCQACGARFEAADYLEARARTCPDCLAAARRGVSVIGLVVVCLAALVAVGLVAAAVR